MTRNELVDLLIEAADLALSKSASKRGRAAEIAERVRREWPRARWTPQVTCVACLRERRCWFGTGVACGRLEPLCSRGCVDYWLTHMWPGNVVYVGHGREWQDELPARRRAA